MSVECSGWVEIFDDFYNSFWFDINDFIEIARVDVIMSKFSGNDILKKLIEDEGRTQMSVSNNVFGQRNRLAIIFKNDTDIKLSTFAAICDELGYDVKVVKRDVTEYSLDQTLRRNSNYGNK